MFKNEYLEEHLKTSSTIEARALVVAEINMNIAGNTVKVGNYRYRPVPTVEGDEEYGFIGNTYSTDDKSYVGATDADIVIDGGFNDLNEPIAFIAPKEKERLLYSLEDCIGRFRPRSGINKLRYFEEKYTHHENIDLATRPRYYMADKEDNFKYWTSYRTETDPITETAVERGVSREINGINYIDDAAPFVIYKDPVPVNRLVLKMQTNIGTTQLGPFSNSFTSFSDPFFGQDKATVPQKWKIQYLSGTTWKDAATFDETSTRADGSPIVSADGYLQLSYGLFVPQGYENTFSILGERSSDVDLPDGSFVGEAYFIKNSEEDPGTFSVWDGEEYEIFPATYGWSVDEEGVRATTRFLKSITSPPSFSNPIDNSLEYREFQYISGIRVVVESMNVDDCSFDLIEISSRLAVDLSEHTSSFSLTKTASDLGVSGMPVGQLLAATGSIDIFDSDDAFNENNALSVENPSGSVLSRYVSKSLQIKFYEKIINVPDENNTRSIFYVPIKTMYSDGFPDVNKETRNVTIPLRDLFFYFESITAPQILIRNASISYAVSLLLDSIGFTNYSFKRVPGESELIIPYFFIAPEKSVAQVLEELAIATQTAMFFDEYNNFVMFSRNYMMPSIEERPTSLTLRGTVDYADSDVTEDNPDATTSILENRTTNPELANIVSVSQTQNNVFNDGMITYTNRYIQRTYNSLRQASVIDQDKSWIYKPVLLWEVSGTATTKSINDDSGMQSTYMLSAIPLNSNLPNTVPEVINYTLINNTMDLGEGIYWISRYNGYFYANGEIIRYDAVEYSVPGVGNVWVRDNEEYQQYFSNIPFNGKMYPTGVIRIYAEPNFEVIDGNTRLRNGEVAKHGRAQFGTAITSHFAGINNYWSNSDPETAPVRGINMDADYIFSINTETVYNNTHSPSLAAVPIVINNTTIEDESVTVMSTVGTTHEFYPGDQVKFARTDTSLSISDVFYKSIFYVSRSYLSDRTFCVAETREDALAGATELFEKDETKDYTVKLEPSNTYRNVSIETGDKTKIIFSSAHNMLRDQRVFFKTTGALPPEIVPNATYYVIEDTQNYPITSNSFYISNSWRGEPIFTSPSQSGTHSLTTGYNEEISKATIVVPDATTIKVGSRVEMITGPGRLKTDTRVTAVHLATKQIKNIQSISTAVGNTGEIRSFFHGLQTGDKIEFDTTGTLPLQIVKKVAYYVIRESASSFKIASSRSSANAGLGINSFSGEVTGSAWFIRDIYDTDRITISPAAEIELTKNFRNTNNIPVANNIKVKKIVDTELGKAGWTNANNETARKTTRNSIIKNFLAKSSFEEADTNRMYTTQTGTIQSSALVMNGPAFNISQEPIDFVSYAYKSLETEGNKFTHFGTRLRIIGRKNSSENNQTPIGAMPYYPNVEPEADEPINIAGASGGLSLLLNPETNNGYFFEIIALTDTNLNRYSSSGNIHNIVFYKTVRDSRTGTENSTRAIPIKLWGGLTKVISDDGTFAGQFRMATEESPTVYDLAVEYIDEGTVRKFFLYLNNQVIAVVEDPEPLPIYNNMALFVRGSSRVMFENIYALANNYSQSTVETLTTPIAEAFAKKAVRVDESFRKYAMSGVIQETYLTGLDPSQPPKYNIYYEEFGTIMREAAYFNVRYDKAYPAFYAKMSPTFSPIKGYTVSGFRAGSYGAEFLVFNNTDTALSLDETTGNYLRIQGVTFTQQSTDEYSVDEYFSKLSDFSKIKTEDENAITSINRKKQEKEDIRNSRITYGKNEFNLSSSYIQSHDAAQSLMGWMISKIMKPRKSVGVQVFGLPIVQLGDIVNIDYVADGADQIAPPTSRFVVYSMEYENSVNGPSTVLYLSEVV